MKYAHPAFFVEGVYRVLNLCLALLVSAAPAGDDTKLVVLELQAGSGVEQSVAGALTDAVTAEVTRRGFFQVISSRDVQTLLGLERQKLPEIAPRELDYAEVCGSAIALSSTGAYLLRADSGAIGRWERIPLEQLWPAFKRLPPHFVGPLHVNRTAKGAQLLVFSTSGAVTEVRFTCP